MFFGRNKLKEGSLSSITWQRFKKNRVAIVALCWLGFSVLIAILGYTITPDSTPFANHQQLEIIAKKPGFESDFLFVRKNEPRREVSFIKKMISGKPSPYLTIPVNEVWFENEYVFVEEFSRDPKIAGREINFHLADVVFAMQEYESIEDNIIVITIDGEKKVIPIEKLQQKVKEESIVTKTFILGTDRFGRDMLSQLIIGTRVSLSVGFIAVFISLLVGLFLGSLGGFFRGFIDDCIVWIINIVWSLPTILLVIAITFAVGQGFWQIFVAVGLTMWVEVARITRGQIISIREKEFVEAAKALGLPNFRIILKHILPNIMGPVVVISAANFASAILIEAGLSFLGIGVQPPVPSWGNMIKEHYGYIILDKAYMAILPGICIMFSVLSLMLVSNGLRDAISKN